MNCHEAREAMLVADPTELQGGFESATPLATHVASCETCRELARRLSNDLGVLSMSVAARTRIRSRRPSIRRVALIAAIPAAAAVAAFIALGVRSESPAPATSGVQRTASNVVSVDIARGQQATVIRTQDPKVTVVWLTPGGGL
jgi:hypothetical protein